MNVIQAEDISHFLSPKESPPSMVLDRTDEEDALTLPSPMTRNSLRFLSICSTLNNHFIPGLLGYDGIILEVTEYAQVVTVMLF